MREARLIFPLVLATLMSVGPIAHAGLTCPADVNDDSTVNVTDLLAVIGTWGPCTNCPQSACATDINGDCQVNVTDLLAVIGAWGACPCSPLGEWANASPVTYTCAFGLVNINIAQWTFSEFSGNLRVTAGTQIPAMDGLLVSCQSGSVFSVTGVFPGSCTETYSLTGTFSSPSQFSGTFTMTYTSTGGSCFDCVTQEVNVEATRR